MCSMSSSLVQDFAQEGAIQGGQPPYTCNIIGKANFQGGGGGGGGGSQSQGE